MKFAKIVFAAAGIWGIIVTVPLYFLEHYVGRQNPPELTHPEFYYGFVGVTNLALVASDRITIATATRHYRTSRWRRTRPTVASRVGWLRARWHRYRCPHGGPASVLCPIIRKTILIAEANLKAGIGVF